MTKRVTGRPRYGVAIDQYGRVFRYGAHARKDLMRQLDSKHADKMYVDKRKGPPMHIGYIIRGHWLTLYAPVELPA